MNKKIIGITTRYDKDEQFNNNIKQFLNDEFEIVFIHSTKEFEDVCDKVSGFIMQGGPDVNPALYGDENSFSKELNDEIDKLDKKALVYAELHNIPYFGICRGMQLIAACLGGSCYQDIYQAGLNHPLDENNRHKVRKLVNYKLSNLFPDEFETNSIHHQAVNQIPYGFLPIFASSDVIEGIIHLDKPIFGVQWHPEKEMSNESQIIFNYFKDLVNNERNN